MEIKINEKINLLGKMSSYKNSEGSKEIIIFPEIPFWFIASKGSSDIMRKVNGMSLQEVRDLDSQTQEFVNMLINEGILYVGDVQNSPDNNEEKTEVYPLQGVWLNIESRCNINCRHCFLGEKTQVENKLSPQEMRKLAAEIVKVGGKNGVKLDITGGEPLLRKDIVEIFDAINIPGIEPNFITNGLLFTEEIVHYLAQHKIPTTISLDGVDKAAHEYIRGAGTYDKTIRNIKWCVDKGVPVTLSITIHRGNQHEIIEYFKFADEIGADRVILNFLNNFGNAEVNGLKIPEEYLVTKKILEYATVDERLFNKLIDTAISKLIETVLLPIRTDCCGSGINTCSISANGDVYPCPSFQIEQYKAENIRNRSFADIWKDSNTFKEHRSVNISNLNPICEKCDFRFFCGGGCRAQAYYTNNNNIRARSEKCADYKKTFLEIMWLIEKYPVLSKLHTMEGKLLR